MSDTKIASTVYSTRERVAQAALTWRARGLGLPASVRDAALQTMARALQLRAAEIREANEADLARGRESGLATPLLKRLAFDAGKLADALAGIEALRSMPDPLGRVLEARLLDEGLTLRRVSCPIGLVAMIFESRPDALVQMAGLAVRSGNAIVLKGGREAAQTNKVLAAILAEAGEAAGLPPFWLTALESREEVGELLALHEYVDLVIPRGSKEFVASIMEKSRIPVLGHADGVCHVYLHEDADTAMAAAIVLDSKTQYPAACNAAEVLLVQAAAARRLFVPVLGALAGAGVRLELCPESRALLASLIEEARTDGSQEAAALETLVASGMVGDFAGDDWSVEYLGLRMAVKIVDGLEGAIEHINHFGSGHTDAIVCASPEAASRFMNAVDSSSVYHNASTRFADGYRYGLGAEVGISTGKIHARGPMGVQGLLSSKWKLEGSGQIVADYAEGRAHFIHRDIPSEEGQYDTL